MASGSLRAHFGLVPVFLWAQSGLTPSSLRAHSELRCRALSGLENRIEMASGSFRAHSNLDPGLFLACSRLTPGLFQALRARSEIKSGSFRFRTWLTLTYCFCHVMLSGLIAITYVRQNPKHKCKIWVKNH